MAEDDHIDEPVLGAARERVVAGIGVEFSATPRRRAYFINANVGTLTAPGLLGSKSGAALAASEAITSGDNITIGNGLIRS